MMFSPDLTKMDDEWKERFQRQNDAMRIMSGKACDSGALVTFLYLLMRDSLPIGAVEQKASEATIAAERCVDEGPESAVQFTNGWLARYAKDMAYRLTRKYECVSKQEKER